MRNSPLFDILLFLVVAAGLVALAARGAADMDYTWQWARLAPYLWRVVDGEIIPGSLVKGLLVTLQIAGVAALLTLPLGLALALARLSDSIVGRFLAAAYVEIIRNTPLLLQILIVYFIIGRIFGLSRWWCGVLTLAWYEATFAAEIIRGSILAVARGQWEAGRALGLGGFDIYRSIVLPQALPLMAPPMTGVLVNLVKHSSIVSVIAIFDLTNEGRTIAADTFMSFEVWLVVATMYLSVTVTMSLLAAWLEKRLAPVLR
ncbi:MAG: polar amino acid ABC transporter permease [Rhizobiales bacterium 65-9]|nr:MAG: polar amino acid ABC transporter permease [Rhizobiales bacterium 65-9]